MSEKHGSRWLEREDLGAVTVVRLKTKTVDDDIMREVFAPIYSLVSDVGRHNLVLNLATITYLPSMGLGKLVMLNRKAQAAGGRLALCQLTPATEEVLKITHIYSLFDVFGSEQEAVQSFAGGSAGRLSGDSLGDDLRKE
jgi:anti-anti-sigma factor